MKKSKTKVKALRRSTSNSGRKDKNLFVWVALILLVVGGLVYYFISQSPAKTPQAAGRDAALWPFDKYSPWNMPIGSKAQYVDAQINMSGKFQAVEGELVFLDKSAPLRTLFAGSGGGEQWWPGAACNTGLTNRGDIHVDDGYVVPNPTSGEDGSLPNRAGGALKADNKTIQEFQYSTRCNATGPVTAGAFRTTYDINGKGIPTNSSTTSPEGYGAHGGSGLSGVGGSLRKWEINDSGSIRHALKMTVNVGVLSKCNGGYRWPAITADSGYNVSGGTNEYFGSVCDFRMGSLGAINKDVNCQTFVATPLGKRICQALQDYGAYIVDTGPRTWGAMAILGEYGSAGALDGAGGDIEKMFDNLYVIANNNSDAPGGCAISDTSCTRRQPYAPDFGSAIASPTPTPSPVATTQPVLTTPTPTPTPTTSPTQPPSSGPVTVKVVSGDPANGQYAVQATTSVTGDIKVDFYIDGASTYKQRENEAPYSLFGDANGVLTKGTLGKGAHTIEARVTAQNGTSVLAKGSVTVTEGSSPGTTGTVIEAETFKLNSGYKDPGVNLFSDSSASGGKGFIVWSPGNATASATAAFSKATFRVKADVCEGNPKLTIKINDNNLYSQEVSNTSWHDITVNFAGAAGATLKVELSNDLYKPGVCDRNLRFDKVTLQ